ncbi:hypothetical protein NM208_g15956 [Fusarium decemcellulare]|uniref:Uncharacterized protein n=1 Tax=Fusarium decemcellulare TaxID=57161 RepID=A0ACC1RC44_9HYPO|nr:hypothetical protein NM208_g15956 [Fusarium decemcellulare]
MDQSGNLGKDQLTLQAMPQRRQAWVSGEDWTGVTEATLRRKLQNRLNQRAWRSRQKLKQSVQATASESNEKSPDLPADTLITTEVSATLSNRASSERSPETWHPTENRSICRMGDSRMRSLVEQLARQAWYEYQSGAPCFVHLSALTKINVFRALSSNAVILGCSSEWLDNDAVSRLQVGGDTCQGSVTPSALQPNSLQRTVSHHPWIDLLPVARMRQNLLEALHYRGFAAEDELCYDIVDIGFGGGPDEPSLIVWGQPWDPCGWEVSVAFLRKWGWLMQGCVVFAGNPFEVLVQDLPVPTLQQETDAVVRITTAGICGSDLHVYRGVMGGGQVPFTIGHEAIGYISEIGSAVTSLSVGDYVVIPDTPSSGVLELESGGGAYFGNGVGLDGLQDT